MNKEDIEKKHLEFQLVNQQSQKVQEQLFILSQQKKELKKSIEDLNDFTKIKEGSRLFSPIIPGIFLDTELKDNKYLLVNVGSGIIMKKTIKETINFIDQRIDEISKVAKQLENYLINLDSESQKLEEEINEFTNNK